MSRSPIERLLARIDIDAETGCWNWPGATNSKGYGSIGVDGTKTALTHRVAYEAIVGPIPPGLTIDHLCMNKRCVNPDHLEVVTVAENSRRGQRVRGANDTGWCRRGWHPLTPNSGGCRTCDALRSQAIRLLAKENPDDVEAIMEQLHSAEEVAA